MPLGVANYPSALDVHASDGTATPETFSEVPRLVSGTITASITDSGTTLTVPDTSILPTKGVITVENETMKWTAKPSGTTLTVVRGQFGSTAVAHNNGALFAVCLTAGQFNAHAKAITELEKKLGINSSTASANKILGADGTGQSSYKDIAIAQFLSGAAALVKIGEATVSGSAVASISFNSIPGTYKHLFLTGSLRMTAAGGAHFIQMNGDTGTNYDRKVIYSNNGVLGASEQLAQIYMATVGVPGSGIASSYFSVFYMLLFNYSATNIYKNAVYQTGNMTGSTTGLIQMSTNFAIWKNTGAITSILNAMTAGNIDIGSTITLYGIPA